jgi:hypothetical protein
MLNLERMWMLVAELTNQYTRGLISAREYESEMHYAVISKVDAAIHATECPF